MTRRHTLLPRSAPVATRAPIQRKLPQDLAWASIVELSGCRTSASRRCSTPSRTPPRPRRPITRSAPSSPISAGCRCPTPRLDTLARLAKSAKSVPTQLEIKDIAGLVRGASKGEGLGNKFLGAIREVDAILQVLRCFEDFRRHPCRGQRRSPARRRADRDRAAAGRSGKSRAAEGRLGQTGPRPGQGGESTPGAARPHPARTGSRPAGTVARSHARRARAIGQLQSADRQARPLCLQRRRSLGRRRAMH